jgi:hypothetical protein
VCTICTGSNYIKKVSVLLWNIWLGQDFQRKYLNGYGFQKYRMFWKSHPYVCTQKYRLRRPLDRNNILCFSQFARRDVLRYNKEQVINQKIRIREMIKHGPRPGHTRGGMKCLWGVPISCRPLTPAVSFISVGIIQKVCRYPSIRGLAHCSLGAHI